jgi:hypothetical protein
MGPTADAGPDEGSATDVGRVLERSMPLTMASEADVRFTADRALDLIDRGVPGALVECGVWRGGCSIAMLLAQNELRSSTRKVFLLDSFEGLPPATERDGPLALAWQSDTSSPTYYDNCRASLDEVRASPNDLEVPRDSWELVPGWFEDTVPVLAQRLCAEGIALLRLDGDWYESTMVCLEHLVPVVPEGGMVILDDYYAWDGCARATHDYLSSHDAPNRVRGVPGGYGAYFVKQAHRVGPLTAEY